MFFDAGEQTEAAGRGELGVHVGVLHGPALAVGDLGDGTLVGRPGGELDAGPPGGGDSDTGLPGGVLLVRAPVRISGRRVDGDPTEGTNLRAIVNLAPTPPGGEPTTALHTAQCR